MDYRKDYLSKTLAGTIFGIALALAFSALVAWATPGGPGATNKFQFAMWITSPVWAAVQSGVYLFRDGRQAWRWLGSACGAVVALVAVIRYFAMP